MEFRLPLADGAGGRTEKMKKGHGTKGYEREKCDVFFPISENPPVRTAFFKNSGYAPVRLPRILLVICVSVGSVMNVTSGFGSLSAEQRVEVSQQPEDWGFTPGKGPYQYGRLSFLARPPGRESEPCLAFYGRGRTGIQIRLRHPLRLQGAPRELQIAVLGSGAGDTLFGIFNDRTGKQIRLALGRLPDESRWQVYKKELRGQVRRRPERVAEEAWIEFVGWFIEPDLRRKTETTWLCLGKPIFTTEPYRMDLPL